MKHHVNSNHGIFEVNQDHGWKVLGVGAEILENPLILWWIFWIYYIWSPKKFLFLYGSPPKAYFLVLPLIMIEVVRGSPCADRPYNPERALLRLSGHGPSSIYMIPPKSCLNSEHYYKALNLRLNNYATQEKWGLYMVLQNRLCPRQKSSDSHLDSLHNIRFQITCIYNFCFLSS